MEINGLPVHPLVIHVVVALVPLAVLSGWSQAFLPGWRWLSRWVALAASAAALAAVVVARQTGEELLQSRPSLASAGSEVRELIETHEHLAGLLLWLAVAHLVVVGAAFWLLPAASGLASGRGGHERRDDVRTTRALQALLLVVGAAALVVVVLTGDAGARAVWGGGSAQ